MDKTMGNITIINYRELKKTQTKCLITSSSAFWFSALSMLRTVVVRTSHIPEGLPCCNRCQVPYGHGYKYSLPGT